MEQDKKSARYQRIIKQLEELFIKTSDPIARMSTTAAVLHHKMENFYWTGFYQLLDKELTVGPYQGNLACLILKKHTGVCWSAVDKNETVIVTDVHQFVGHIACDSRSNSEIVIPVRDNFDKIVAVLDVDSTEFANFDETDAVNLEKIACLIYQVQGKEIAVEN